MKTKIIISFVLGGIIGALASHFLLGRTGPDYHWRAVYSYNAFLRDPANAEHDPQSGLSYVSPPTAIEPHLAALVAAGELRYIDIVLPTVPYANKSAVRHWMQYCEEHYPGSIVYAEGNHTYVAFAPKGEQPLQIKIWYKNGSEAVIKQLISELEEFGSGAESEDQLNSEQ